MSSPGPLNPRFDVVVPCYNYGRFLSAAVESVLAQDVDARVCIIDDASQDETPDIGRALAQRSDRVEFVRHASNRGHIATYNEGIEWASGDYFVLLSADDALMPGALSRAAGAFEARPELVMVFGRALHFLDGEPLQEVMGLTVTACASQHIHARVDAGSGVSARALEDSGKSALSVLDATTFYGLNKASNLVPACGTVTRTGLQKRLGGYLPSLPHAGDYEMWLRFSAHGPVGYVPHFQIATRDHAVNMQKGYDGVRDILQRGETLLVLRRTCGARLPDGLLDGLCRYVAREALGYTTIAFQNRSRGDAGALVSMAKALDPSITRSAAWAVYAMKRAVGPRVWAALRRHAWS